MKTISILLLTVLLASHAAHAETSIAVPYEEFKQLYKDQIERKLAEKQQKENQTKVDAVYALDQAVYSLDVHPRFASGSLQVSGKWISGDLKPIELFASPLTITQITEHTGGDLIHQPGGGGLAFLPEKAGDFGFQLEFLLPVEAENTVRFAAFKSLPAISNTLELRLPPDTLLTEKPGIETRNGHFLLPPDKTVRLAFLDKRQREENPTLEIDTLTVVSMDHERIMLDWHFLPARQTPLPFQVRVAEDIVLLSSSLETSRVVPVKDHIFQITPPPTGPMPFSLRFRADTPKDGSRHALHLPKILGPNTGRAGILFVEPEDGRIAVDSAQKLGKRAISSLPSDLQKAAGGRRQYFETPSDDTLRFSFNRFEEVQSPDLVLNRICFFIGFEESGQVLTVLSIVLPPRTDGRFSLDAVPGADIWSLQVNGIRQRLFTQKGEDGKAKWTIPLSPGKPSRIKLAYIQTHQKLRLQGKLETAVPALGIPARHLLLGIGLPQRVMLQSFEGPASPAHEVDETPPDEFKGSPHYFSRAFYTGEALRFAFTYKEPVKTNPK